MNGPLLDALLHKRVIVCVGSGGVGKTTVAAALALEAARQGRRAIVCTIDPARRLANALGLAQLGNVETRIDAARLQAAGLSAKGELWAMMLDLKRSWDDLLSRHLPADKRERIFQNRFYVTLSSALAGSQEYIAMEKLYELHASDRFDLVVLDTPPTSNALDFLNAPDRILDFLDNEAAKVLLGPALKAGSVGLKLFQLGGGYVARTLSRFTGAETLQELAAFMVEIQGTYGVFKDRAARVKELLGSSETAFAVVTSAHALTVDEAIYFHALLAEERMQTAAVVCNRVHHDPLAGLALPEPGAVAAALAGRGLPIDLGDRLVEVAREARVLAALDARHLGRLAAAVAPTPLVAVPRFPSDVYDLPSLAKIAAHLTRPR